MRYTRNEDRASSKWALASMAAGIVSLVLLMEALYVYVVKHSVDSAVGVLIPQVFLAIVAVIAGHAGTPMNSAMQGTRGRGLASKGLFLGYAQLVGLALFLLGLAAFMNRDERDDVSLLMQEQSLAATIMICKTARDMALLNKEPFSCGMVETLLTPSTDLTITVRQHGPNSCLVTVTAQGSDSPSTRIWQYDP